MKTIILCGGRGLRLGTAFVPKPLVKLNGRPILRHLMDCYGAYGFKDFVLALGYKDQAFKNYFTRDIFVEGNCKVDLQAGVVTRAQQLPDWTVSLVETGLDTATGGRLLRLKPYLEKEELFAMTYGDGLANVDLGALLRFHKRHNRIATLTAVRPPGRFGDIEFADEKVERFVEKAVHGRHWINGGFFILSRHIFKYLADDDCIFERKPLERLAREGQLMAFPHTGFWQCMDTAKDRETLENLAQTPIPPWQRRDSEATNNVRRLTTGKVQ